MKQHVYRSTQLSNRGVNPNLRANSFLSVWWSTSSSATNVACRTIVMNKTTHKLRSTGALPQVMPQQRVAAQSHQGFGAGRGLSTRGTHCGIKLNLRYEALLWVFFLKDQPSQPSRLSLPLIRTDPTTETTSRGCRLNYTAKKCTRVTFDVFVFSTE